MILLSVRGPAFHQPSRSAWTPKVAEEGYNFVYTSTFITKTEDEEYEEITKRLTFVVTKVEDRRIIEAKLFIEVVLDEDESDDSEKDE